jgi:hypothetical protein
LSFARGLRDPKDGDDPPWPGDLDLGNGPGYEGAGTGTVSPARQPAGGREPGTNNRTRTAPQRSLRCLGEQGLALLTGRWRTLRHITASPSTTGGTARAALALTHFGHGCIT